MLLILHFVITLFGIKFRSFRIVNNHGGSTFLMMEDNYFDFFLPAYVYIPNRYLSKYSGPTSVETLSTGVKALHILICHYQFLP